MWYSSTYVESYGAVEKKLNKRHSTVCPVVSYGKVMRKLQSMQHVSGTVKTHLSKTDEFDYQIRPNSSTFDWF